MRFLCLAIVLSALQASSLAQQLPSGWALPDSKEQSQEWRNRDLSKFLEAKGDFDGDDKEDVARLLCKQEGEGYALFVWLSTKTSPIELVTNNSSITNVGIAKVKPGTYETACGKGYGDWACAHGEPKILHLKQDAISFFVEESAEAFYVWNPKTRKFKRIQISD